MWRAGSPSWQSSSPVLINCLPQLSIYRNRFDSLYRTMIAMIKATPHPKRNLIAPCSLFIEPQTLQLRLLLFFSKSRRIEKC